MLAKVIDFFILGYPRSGTTLLRMTLNGLAKIKVNPECSFLTFLYDNYSSFQYPLTKANISEFVKTLQNSRKFDTWQLETNFLIRNLNELSPKNYGELCAYVYQLHEPNKQIHLLGDKNNVHIFEVNKILSVYPSCKFVYLIRDPRDVYSSLKTLSNLPSSIRYSPTPPNSLIEFCNNWRNAYAPLKKQFLSSALTESNVFTVKYEDFVRSNKEVLIGILEFLDYPNISDLANLDMNELHLIGHDEPDELMSWKRLTLEPISDISVGKWRNTLSSEEEEHILYRLRDEMEFFDYI